MREQTDYKQKCLDIYYASDVVDKSLAIGCRLYKGRRAVVVDTTNDGEYIKAYYEGAEVEDAFFSKQHFYDEGGQIIGHPPTLASWLRLMGIEKMVDGDGNTWQWNEATDRTELVPLTFNLTTEEPTDWEALYNIIK